MITTLDYTIWTKQIKDAARTDLVKYQALFDEMVNQENKVLVDITRILVKTKGYS
jgi:ribosomal protein S17E